MAKQDNWLTTQQAAELTGYTVFYIQDLAREGKVKAKKVSIVWLVERESLLNHVKQVRSQGEKPGPKTKG